MCMAFGRLTRGTMTMLQYSSGFCGGWTERQHQLAHVSELLRIAALDHVRGFLYVPCCEL